MVVDQIGVRRGVLQRLVGVRDTAGHEHRDRRVDLGVERGAEGRAFAQVDPRAEDPAGGHGDVLVPRFRVDAAGRAPGVVERDVVLDRAEVGQSERDHLLPLPVLLEPATVVLGQGQPDDEQARDRGLLDDEVRHH